MALFLMLFAVGCQKASDQPNPKTETAKSPRGDKSGSQTVLDRLVSNVHFRSMYASYRMLDSLHLTKIHSLNTQGKRDLHSLMSSFDENTTIETRMAAFDISSSAYHSHVNHIIAENLAMHESLPELRNMTQSACTELIGLGWGRLNLEFGDIVQGFYTCKEILDACLTQEKVKNSWNIIGITWGPHMPQVKQDKLLAEALRHDTAMDACYMAYVDCVCPKA